MGDFPLIVSADDHVVEPADLWTSRLPAKYQDVAPRVVREKGEVALREGDFHYEQTDEGRWADVWYYEDVRVPATIPGAAVGYSLDDVTMDVMTFDEMRPGCYQPKARLEDMDVAGIDRSLCFPNLFIRFCGQRFLQGQDRELARLCVEAYNDFIVEEWCAGSDGRLIPLGIIPLWDADLAAAEVHRMAEKGMHAMCFSEMPAKLGLPSIHGDHWDPFFAACEETETAIMVHIGSSSQLPVTSSDAPNAVQNSLPAVNSAMCMVDWLFSGLFIQFPNIKLGLAECQIGWIPYFLQRADEVWEHNRGWNEVRGKIPEPPSTYFPDHIWCTFFSDAFGLDNLDAIGADNVIFETDYPHSDSNWPDSLEVAKKQTEHLDPVTTEKIVRGNALQLLGLQ
ncbi:MAG: amidohydrolase [Actinobacteria bacterium]|nr:amidohydrolase [Actinomycetota bacterium]